MNYRLLATILVLAASARLDAGEPASAPATTRDKSLTYTPPATPAPPDPGGLVFRLSVLTVAMLLLSGGVMWFSRRLKRGQKTVSSNGRLFHDGRLSLDRRSSLHLIRADGQTVAVTIDSTGIRSMALLSDPFDQVLDEVTEATPTAEHR